MTLKVAIIGAGQQGASIARALNHEDYAVSIYDVSQNVLHTFGQQTQTDRVTICDTADAAVEGADIVVLATPIDRFASTVHDISGALKPGSIVTDIGSGKEKAIAQIIHELPEGIFYVPVHPINGKAKPGPENSDPQMYKGQTIVVVPGVAGEIEETTVAKLWQDMGGRITRMDAKTHDNLYGTISHFEHVVAFALTKSGENIDAPGTASDDYKKAGKTALATTRIAAGSADMWIPVFRDNKTAILKAAEGFKANMQELMHSLETSPDKLKQSVVDAHEYRKKIPDHRRESIEGEVEDLKMSGDFNDEALARRVTLASFIGAALTLNAKNTDQSLSGVSITQVANPSFKDGSAPMLSDPSYLTALFVQNKEKLGIELGRFFTEFDTLVDHIKKDDGVEIRKYIEAVNGVRAQMPAKADPAQTRPRYEVFASLG